MRLLTIRLIIMSARYRSFVRIATDGLLTAIVDPLIRAEPGQARIYDGYFVQRCAAELSVAAARTDCADRTLKDYLSSQRWQTLRRKNLLTELRSLPGLKLGYSLAVEYAERFFAMGRFSEGPLLSSDAREAVVVCGEYLEHICDLGPTLFVVRETQHIDHYSLRFLLQLNGSRQNQHLIFEYTADEERFESDHEKLIQRELPALKNAKLLQLLALDRSHLDVVLRRMGAGAVDLNSDFFGKWDGDLRRLYELKYRVSIGQNLLAAPQSEGTATSLAAEISTHVGELTSALRWMLAIIIAHGEPIPRRVLFATTVTRGIQASEAGLSDDLKALAETHNLVSVHGDQVSVIHDGVATAARDNAGIVGLVALAEKALRDLYRQMFERGEFTVASLAAVVRRLFVLCVRTGDISLLLRLIDEIDGHIAGAYDQAPYIDIAIDAVASAPGLLPAERKRIVDWAGFLAYELNDFRDAVRLMLELPEREPIEQLILAFSHTECGDHDAAAAVADQILSDSGLGDFHLAADMVLAGNALDAGRWSECRTALNSIVERGAGIRSPIVGHAYRLLAEIEDYPSCTEAALKSVAWFRDLGLSKAAAYSALSASRFLARTGQTEEAIQLIDAADGELRNKVRNRHILLNNRALVGLLTAAPDYQVCANWLREALLSSRDDFSDLTILSNLAVAHWKRGAIEEAAECVTRCKPILDQPHFTERDVFWPVCFNLGQVLAAAGDHAGAEAMRARPAATGWNVRGNRQYWDYRYGASATPDPALAHLLRFDYHPAALSHWQLDLDVLKARTQGSRE